MELKYMSKLKGHRVLVLGGSSGIGFGVAEAALEHGASVVVSSSNQVNLDKAVARLADYAKAVGSSPGAVSGKICDISNSETLENNIIGLLEFATQSEKLDHVVLTAGDPLKLVAVKDITIADINQQGMTRYIALIMLAKHLPNYINAGPQSSYTLTGGSHTWRPGPNWTVLAGLGGAIEAMARGLAVDLKPIRVNCVRLGAVSTELHDKFRQNSSPEAIERMLQDTIIGGVAKPEEVVEAYLHCMKNTYATASVVETNGGKLAGDSRG